jgi:hypothetical protein
VIRLKRQKTAALLTVNQPWSAACVGETHDHRAAQDPVAAVQCQQGSGHPQRVIDGR